MSEKNDQQQVLNLKVLLFGHEKTAAKALAKSKGMTFQGFVGQLIRQALAESEGSLKQQSYLEGGR